MSEQEIRKEAKACVLAMAAALEADSDEMRDAAAWRMARLVARGGPRADMVLDRMIAAADEFYGF